MNIVLKNLIFSGIHGVTAKEQKTSQRFCITITIDINEDCLGINDDLSNTIDYRQIKKSVQDIIEGASHYLLETLADTIAQEVLDNNDRVHTIQVHISKPDIWESGTPAIVVKKARCVPTHDLASFDAVTLVKDLHMVGATSFPLIPVKRRLDMIAEAKGYTYYNPQTPDNPLVQQDFENVSEFFPNSLFKKLADDFYRSLIQQIPRCELPTLFSPALAFNELRLQRYRKDSIGITPHRDGKSKLNMVCIFVLKGGGVFGLCDNRDGLNARIIPAQPGDVIIIRAPGFMHSDYQPFHFVSNIQQERLVFGLRQVV